MEYDHSPAAQSTLETLQKLSPRPWQCSSVRSSDKAYVDLNSRVGRRNRAPGFSSDLKLRGKHFLGKPGKELVRHLLS